MNGDIVVNVRLHKPEMKNILSPSDDLQFKGDVRSALGVSISQHDMDKRMQK